MLDPSALSSVAHVASALAPAAGDPSPAAGPDGLSQTEAYFVIGASGATIIGVIAAGFLWLHRLLARIESTQSKELAHNGGSSTKDLALRAASSSELALSTAQAAAREASRNGDAIAALQRDQRVQTEILRDLQATVSAPRDASLRTRSGDSPDDLSPGEPDLD